MSYVMLVGMQNSPPNMKTNLVFHLKTRHRFITCSINSTLWYQLKRNENRFIQRHVYLIIALNFTPSSKTIFIIKFTLQLVHLLQFLTLYNSSHDIYFEFHILLFIATLLLSIKSERNWNIYQLRNGLISTTFYDKRNEILIIIIAQTNPGRVC